MLFVEAHHRRLVVGTVGGTGFLVLGQDRLDVLRQLCAKARGFADPQRHRGWRVGDDERAQTVGARDRVLHRQHPAP
jgi:hypothetical protein